MPDQRRAHHTKDAVISGTWTRAEQDSAGRIQRRNHGRIGNCHIRMNSPVFKLMMLAGKGIIKRGNSQAFAVRAI
jgi:hypothetical protein